MATWCQDGLNSTPVAVRPLEGTRPWLRVNGARPPSSSSPALQCFISFTFLLRRQAQIFPGGSARSSGVAPPPSPSSTSSPRPPQIPPAASASRFMGNAPRSAIRSDVASGDFTSFLSAFRQSDFSFGEAGPRPLELLLRPALRQSTRLFGEI